MAGTEDERRRGSRNKARAADASTPPSLSLADEAQYVASHAFTLMTLRALSIATKFGLTLFIARYLGLAQLGIYGLAVSATVLTPVVLGFGVANNLGREAIRHGPSSVTLRMLQYFLYLIPAYAGIGWIIAAFFPIDAVQAGAFGFLLFLEQVQTDLFALMTVAGAVYGANLIYFVRTSAWAFIYMPLALANPSWRSLTVIVWFWLAGDIAATILAVLVTPTWRWFEAALAVPKARLTLPHRHGSTLLYLSDITNTGFQYVDRYIIGIFLSPELLGVYTLFWSVVNAISNMIANAAVQTRKGALVQMARDFSRQAFNRSLRNVAIMSSQLATALSAAAIVLMYLAIPYIRRPELDRYLPTLFILCGAMILRTSYEVIAISFYAYRRDDLILYSCVTTLIVSLALNIGLVPAFGVWGASLALLVSYGIGLCASCVIVYRGFQPHVSATRTAQEPS
jgi:O-antigen/teichoic acid export membrane protein